MFSICFSIFVYLNARLRDIAVTYRKLIIRKSLLGIDSVKYCRNLKFITLFLQYEGTYGNALEKGRNIHLHFIPSKIIELKGKSSTCTINFLMYNPI